MSKNRLSKVLAHAGVASRRKCEELIFQKKVKVNGIIVEMPQHQVDLQKDLIEVDGVEIKKFEKKVYYLLNKPPGYVCTHDTSMNQKRAIDLLPQKERLFTVGRLDKETTGLIILTNDGQLAHQISHPSFEIEKEYLVKTNRDMEDIDLKRISYGVMIEGTLVKPVSLHKVRKGTLKIVVKEGKKHEVRLLVGQTGAEILELSRIRIGNLRLGHLPMGQYKKCLHKELEQAIFAE